MAVMATFYEVVERYVMATFVVFGFTSLGSGVDDSIATQMGVVIKAVESAAFVILLISCAHVHVAMAAYPVFVAESFLLAALVVLACAAHGTRVNFASTAHFMLFVKLLSATPLHN